MFERVLYLYSKLIIAFRNKTLFQKLSLYAYSYFYVKYIIIIGYIKLKNVDKKIDLKKGFSDHRENLNHHKPKDKDIKRILAAYKKAKIDQINAKTEYQIKGNWKEWIDVNYKDLISLLDSNNIAGLGSFLENLFREQATIGTGGYDLHVKYKSLLGNFYIKYAWCKYRDILKKNNIDLKNFDFPYIGNQTGIFHNESIFSIETLRHIYFACSMKDLLENVERPNIVEIGGGLGGQAYQSIKCIKKDLKYLNFDIPEVCVLVSYFLLSAFPDKNIRLYGEGKITLDEGENYNIGIFPAYSIDCLSNTSVDLFFNSCSLSEMDRQTSLEYLSTINRTCKGLILHDNHDKQLKFINTDGTSSLNLRSSDFLPSTDKFKLIYKRSRTHGLPEDYLFKHYEYLYKSKIQINL